MWQHNYLSTPVRERVTSTVAISFVSDCFPFSEPNWHSSVTHWGTEKEIHQPLFSDSYLIEKQLSSLLLAKVHLFDSHLTAISVGSNAHNTCWTLPNLHEAVKKSARVPWSNHHLERCTELYGSTEKHYVDYSQMVIKIFISQSMMTTHWIIKQWPNNINEKNTYIQVQVSLKLTCESCYPTPNTRCRRKPCSISLCTLPRVEEKKKRQQQSEETLDNIYSKIQR